MLPCRQTAPLFWHRVWVKAATKLEPWDSAWPVWTLLYSDILAKVLTWKSLLCEGAFVNARIQMSECKFICWFCVNWLMSILEFRCLCARSCARGIQMSFCRFLYQSSDAGSVLMGECQCWNSHVFVQILVPEFTCQFCVNGWMPVVEFTCLCAIRMPEFLCQFCVNGWIPMLEFTSLYASYYARVQMTVQSEWVNANAGIHMPLCKFLCQSSFSFPELWCVKRIQPTCPVCFFKFQNVELLQMAIMSSSLMLHTKRVCILFTVYLFR